MRISDWSSDVCSSDLLGLHAFHASELPYVFGTADRTPPRWPKVPNYSADLKLSEAMRGYWASFARSALPKAAGQPDWTAFAPAKAYMYFAGAPRVADRKSTRLNSSH